MMNVQDEAFYVLEGEISVRCGEQAWRGETGTSVFLPQGVPHAYKVEGNTPLKIPVITSPGGTLSFDRFVEEMGTLTQTRILPVPSAPDMEKLQRLVTKYDIEFDNPPINITWYCQLGNVAEHCAKIAA
ncbi:hypothetical protein KSD_72650 [Ktedonobacter sp. SOSP1-85]|uniref:cupin domain-containing protein n=1 Tax=Ktedonobacter sp. SOSP1-85 TaxID=2778367 RepID=UPI0019163B3F|nr:cupin domain-containing protein [Ktedonobacter sp. SOSP1-85]GHO79494.1 hypothetical protein KSD_72650 [Ktedonobacter sp. SOSP1-85]